MFCAFRGGGIIRTNGHGFGDGVTGDVVHCNEFDVAGETNALVGDIVVALPGNGVGGQFGTERNHVVGITKRERNADVAAVGATLAVDHFDDIAGLLNNELRDIADTRVRNGFSTVVTSVSTGDVHIQVGSTAIESGISSTRPIATNK